MRVKSEKLQYKHWHSSISIMKLKLGFEHLEDRVVTHLMDLGCQATFDRFFRGYERFYTCAARHPTGHLGNRKGTWASGTYRLVVWCFSKNHLTDLADSAWLLYYLNIQFNSWSKFMGGRKVAVSLHPMKPRHFRGGRTLDDLWSTIPAGHSVQLLRGADTTDAREFRTRRSYLGMPKEKRNKINVGL